MIKRLIQILALLSLSLSVMGADSQARAKFVLTGIPADGNTLTYRGNVRTWKTTVTSSATQIEIGASAAISANNLVAHLSTYGFDTNSFVIQESVTNVTVLADVNVSVTASLVGAWGSVTVTTTPLTQRSFSFPFVSEDTSTRTNDANDLILAFNYASAAFAANVAALSNYVNVTLAQAIPGAKAFSGANVYSNASQIFTLGNVSNVIGRAIKLKQSATLSGVYMLNSADAAIYTIAPDSAGRPTLKSLTGDTLGTGPTYSPNADDILSRAIADNYYGRLAQDNHWTGVQSFDSIDGANIDGPVITSADITALIIRAGLAQFTDHVSITNAAPSLSIVDTDAGTNLKWWKFKADGSGVGANALKLFVTPDDGSEPVGSTVLEITRNNTSTGTTVSSDTELIVYAPTRFEGAVELVGGSLKNASVIESGTGFVAGAVDVGLPSGASGGYYAVDGSAPSGDPTTGFIFWSELGNVMYRSSTASEGSGQANHFHNRTSTTFGAGTDYTLTGSTAFIDFGTTDPKVTLPTAGTYYIFADVSFTTGTTAADDYRFKLRNETTSADISGSDFSTTQFGTAAVATTAHLAATVTATSTSNVIAIWGHNNTAARGTVNSARTRIGYVRLY